MKHKETKELSKTKEWSMDEEDLILRSNETI